MKHKISIVTVSYNSKDWLELLLESIKLYSSEFVEIIVIDNSNSPINIAHDIHYVYLGRNIGHGAGLNLGAELSQTPYTFFLDVDCHFLKSGWEENLLKLSDNYDVIVGKGVKEKPIRPACMFMKTSVAQKYDWRPTPGYQGHRITPEGFDVGIKAYYELMNDKVPLKLLESRKSHYMTLSGEEWLLQNEAFLYHHWHGAHLKERQKDFSEDLNLNKDNLFRQIPWRLANNL